MKTRNSGFGLTFSDYLSIEQFHLFVPEADAVFFGRFSSPSLPLGQSLDPIFVLSDKRSELVRKTLN